MPYIVGHTLFHQPSASDRTSVPVRDVTEPLTLRVRAEAAAWKGFKQATLSVHLLLDGDELSSATSPVDFVEIGVATEATVGVFPGKTYVFEVVQKNNHATAKGVSLKATIVIGPTLP